MNAFIFNGKFMKEKFRDKAVLVAMEGDNNSGIITFEFDRFYPDRRGVDLSAYAWQLLVQGEILPEPHENIITEGTGLAKEIRGSTITVRWTVGGVNAYLEGLGDAQFKAVGAGGEVWKSEVFDVRVLQSINADSVAELYPDILTDLTSRVLALEGRMAIAEDDISEAWDELFRLESDKQDKYDATLNTTDKTVPGAINEIKNTADSAKSTADGLDAKATEALEKAENAETNAQLALDRASEAKSVAESVDEKATQALDKANIAESQADTALEQVSGKYTKPATGIPKSDLSSGVQTSLNKADTALQSESDPTVPGWAKADSKPTYTAAEIGLGNVENVTNAERIAGLLYNPTYNSDTHTLTMQVKGGAAFVVDLPLEALIANISLNASNALVITFEDGTTAEVPLSALLVGVAKSVNGKSADSNGAVSVAIADVPGLESALAGKASSVHTHTVSQITDFPAIPAEQVNSDWNAESGKAQILNKPTIPAVPAIASQAEAEAGTDNTKMMTPLRVKQAIDEFAPDAYVLPTASETVLGGVKVGEGLLMTDGVLSAIGGGGGGGTTVNFYLAEDF